MSGVEHYRLEKPIYLKNKSVGLCAVRQLPPLDIGDRCDYEEFRYSIHLHNMVIPTGSVKVIGLSLKSLAEKTYSVVVSLVDKYMTNGFISMVEQTYRSYSISYDVYESVAGDIRGRLVIYLKSYYQTNKAKKMLPHICVRDLYQLNYTSGVYDIEYFYIHYGVDAVGCSVFPHKLTVKTPSVSVSVLMKMLRCFANKNKVMLMLGGSDNFPHCIFSDDELGAIDVFFSTVEDLSQYEQPLKNEIMFLYMST